MPLTARQIEFWEANSYLSLEGLFAGIATELSTWVDEVASWTEGSGRWLTFHEMHHPENLSRIENFLPDHADLDSVLRGPELIGIIGELMDEPALIYKDRINFKYPRGGAHAAHQDGVAYESGGKKHFSIHSAPFVSALISIDHATIGNGCLQVAADWPTTYSRILPLECPYPEFPNFSKITAAEEDALTWIPLETSPGDVILFTERLPHRSSENDSTKSRRILYGVYNPASAGDMREQYYNEKRLAPNDPRYMIGNPHAPSVPRS